MVCDFVEDCVGGTDESFDICGASQGFEKGLSPWQNSHEVSYQFSIHKGSAASGHSGPTSGDATGNKTGEIFLLDTNCLYQILMLTLT